MPRAACPPVYPLQRTTREDKPPVAPSPKNGFQETERLFLSGSSKAKFHAEVNPLGPENGFVEQKAPAGPGQPVGQG